ncbi:MAG: hypothetical protein QGF46_03315, partial [Planctomycetota bacterium]|nr:hypothetical protein [Planctomycetota bacterium]
MNSGKSNSLALVLVALFVISAGVFVVLGDSSTQTPNEAEPEPEVIETPVIEAAGQLINTQEPTRVDIERNTDISNSEIDNLFADAIGGAVSGKVVNEN